LDEMLANFVINNIRVAGPVFDLTKLKWLNGEYLRSISPEEFYAALRTTVLSDEYLSAIAGIIQTRIELLSQFGDLTGFFFADNIHPAPEVFVPKKRELPETLAFVGEQLVTLEATAWETAAIEAALKKLGEMQQWSVKENFMLLRSILTGSTMSPPLMESLVIFGKARTLDRMRRFLDAENKKAQQKK